VPLAPEPVAIAFGCGGSLRAKAGCALAAPVMPFVAVPAGCRALRARDRLPICYDAAFASDAGGGEGVMPESVRRASVRICLALAGALAVAWNVMAQPLAPDIVVTKVIDAPVADVWQAWTSAEGIESFFAPKAARVEPWPGGAFELWFGVDYPEGSRGSEGCKVHSVKPMEQFVFEWNAPPTLPVIRGLRTLVYLDFRALPDNRTELTLRNFGYGDGEDWAKSKAYFAKAWPNVMASLEKRFQPK
jgi:uncharacterized protein YndB with AHSA1/START domain